MINTLWFITIIAALFASSIIIVLFIKKYIFLLKEDIQKNFAALHLVTHQLEQLQKQQQHYQQQYVQSYNQLETKIIHQYHELQHKLTDIHLNQIQQIQQAILKTMQDIREQIQTTLTQNSRHLSENITLLTQQTKHQLNDISHHVEKRLAEGFDKTSETFIKILERLSIIDAAQKKITELSSNVVNLQEILNDKRSRGAFGEVQLNTLLHNVLPAEACKLQHTLSNGKRIDCLLLLPKPTGNVPIDAKFPLENYKVAMDFTQTDEARKTAEQLFKQDIRKHIKDISEKYIIEGETSDGAIMFLPSESIFAELHANYPDLIEYAHKSRVWLCSPTTMMAILTTACAVLKDVATRKQVHIIQEHLGLLAKDFSRFEGRMEKLAKHIQLANKDVDEIHASAKKITSRFTKIEKVQLQDESLPILLENVLEE
jgi:DNA recombination protein RmuC